jgi:hypothetical protein
MLSKPGTCQQGKPTMELSRLGGKYFLHFILFVRKKLKVDKQDIISPQCRLTGIMDVVF